MLPRGSPLLRPLVGVVGQVVAVDITDYVLHERRFYGLQALPQPEMLALFLIRKCFVLLRFIRISGVLYGLIQKLIHIQGYHTYAPNKPATKCYFEMWLVETFSYERWAAGRFLCFIKGSTWQRSVL